MIYFRLFFEFFIIGMFSIGGGLATVPFLQEISAKTGWFTLEQLTDMIAISESTPGPIGINMATYVGFTTAGFAGSLIASIGLILPAMIIVSVVAYLLSRFKENKIVDAAFYGLRPASVGLVCAAGFGVLRLTLVQTELFAQTGAIADLFDLKAILLAAILFILIKKTKAHPVVFILGSAAAGIIFKFS